MGKLNSSIEDGDPIYAVYPRREEINESPEDFIYNIGVQQQVGAKFQLSNALMTAQSLYNNDGITNLSFQHQLAMVTLKLKLPSGGINGEPTKLYLSSAEIISQGRFNLCTNEWSDQYIAHIQEVELEDVSYDQTIEVTAMLIPTTIENLAIALETSTGDSYETFLHCDRTFEAGVAYVWTISNELEKEDIPRYKRTHVMTEDYMRDPYVVIKDDLYYLTYTSGSDMVPIYSSPDLLNWTLISESYRMSDTSTMSADFYADFADGIDSPTSSSFRVWAPEIIYINTLNKWCLIHTTNEQRAMISLSDTPSFTDLYFPMGATGLGHKHDPSIFIEDDGSLWLAAFCASVMPLYDDLSGYGSSTSLKAPSTGYYGGDNNLGHEGIHFIKFKNDDNEDRYVIFATAWSYAFQDGTYNLYYANADNLMGDNGVYRTRKFVGRCLGHGTVFQDLKGRWWCTAFKNGTYVAPEDIAQTVSSEPSISWSMNEAGFTLVPLHISFDEDGDVVITATDPYATNPGAEEGQQF